MAMTIIEKILAEKSNKEDVKPGDNIWVDVDVLMTHDVCGPGTMGIFKENFGGDARVWDKDKIVLIPDHYIFTKDKYAMRNIEYVTKFAKEQEIKHFYEPFTDDYKGVCHVALAEKGHNKPGDILFGTDSHTCTSGAFGQFASGIGNTDAGFIMGTGKLWVRVPESIKFQFDGKFPSYIMGKDVVLQTIGDIGFDGATYRCMEYTGEGIESFNMEERMTICNMAIEAGGKCGIIAADNTTENYLKERGITEYKIHKSDADADYYSVHNYDAAKIVPVVAKPYSPGNVEPAENLSHIDVTRSYIGSCTGGKTSDFIAAAKILKGEKVRIETFIVPATRNVERNFETIKIGGETLREIFINAGCRIGPPSCAACLGGPTDTFGRTHSDEVVISTTNRNFHGRMGSMESKVYLASPFTAAASALTGKITDPRKYIKKIEVEIDG